MNKSFITSIVTLALITCILLFGCKKEDNKDTSNGVEQKLNSNLNVLHDAAIIYNDEFQQSGDSLAAFDSMRTWLANHDDVSGGWFHNIEFLEVEFSNGLKSPITIIPIADNGEHLRRGGGKASGLAQFSFGAAATKKIKNKKVLVLIPYPDEFQYSSMDIQNLKTTIEAAQPDMEADVITGSNVTLQQLDRLGDYGFVILDMHGLKYGFNLAYLKEEYEITDVWFPEEVIADAFNIHSIPPGKIANGQIEIGLQIGLNQDGDVTFAYTVIITEEYIRQLNIDLSDAVVFGNHCYSGHTADGQSENNLPQAWKSKGVATYYGYGYDNQVSIPVDNGFCKDMEQLLVNGLIVDGDTTGAAHLNPDGSSPFYDSKNGYDRPRAALLTPVEPRPPGRSLFLIQFFDEDYEYETCSEEFVDTRDGTVYKTVCIGDQVWMAENLNYAPAGGYCYDYVSANCNTYGRLYHWQDVVNNTSDTSTAIPSGIQGICPAGWHIPSIGEWDTMMNQLGGRAVAGKKLKGTSTWVAGTAGTNSVGFNALAAGISTYIGHPNFGFLKLGEGAYFWSCSSVSSNTDKRLQTIILGSSDGVGINSSIDWDGGAISCRCVKD